MSILTSSLPSTTTTTLAFSAPEKTFSPSSRISESNSTNITIDANVSLKDITNLSKRIIFLLHRLAADADLSLAASTHIRPKSTTGINDSTNTTPTHPKSKINHSAFQKAVTQGTSKLAEVQSLLRSTQQDLKGSRFWRYQPSVSPGLQEYIEALAFAHYLEHGTLVSYHQVQATLRCAPRRDDGEDRKREEEAGEGKEGGRDGNEVRLESDVKVNVGDDGTTTTTTTITTTSSSSSSSVEANLFTLPYDDYLLGVSDLTGELMRFAIGAITSRGGRHTAREVSDFVRNCKADFEGFTPYVKNLSRKQTVTSQSLQKIEDAAYAIAVRTSEYGGLEDMLEEIVARCVSEVVHQETHERKRRRGEEDEDSGLIEGF